MKTTPLQLWKFTWMSVGQKSRNGKGRNLGGAPYLFSTGGDPKSYFTR